MNSDISNSEQSSSQGLSRKGYVENAELAHEMALVEAPYRDLQAQYNVVRPLFEDDQAYYTKAVSFKRSLSRGIRDLAPYDISSKDSHAQQLHDLSQAPASIERMRKREQDPEVAHAMALAEAPYRNDRKRLVLARETVHQSLEQPVDYELIDTFLLRRGHLAASAVRASILNYTNEPLDRLTLGAGRLTYNGAEAIERAEIKYSEEALAVLLHSEGENAELTPPLPSKEAIADYRSHEKHTQEQYKQLLRDREVNKIRRQVAKGYQEAKKRLPETHHLILDAPLEEIVPYIDREVKKDEIPGIVLLGFGTKLV